MRRIDRIPHADFAVCLCAGSSQAFHHRVQPFSGRLLGLRLVPRHPAADRGRRNDNVEASRTRREALVDRCLERLPTDGLVGHDQEGAHVRLLCWRYPSPEL